MTPSWKFRALRHTEYTATPFYIQPWPDDLPGKCGVCGTEFRFGSNLRIGPGKAGRILRGIAYWGFLPFLLFGGFMLPTLAPEFFSHLGGNHQWWSIFAGMFAPPMIFGALSAVMPGSRLVECKKCGWNHDYKLRKPDPTGFDPHEPTHTQARHAAAIALRDEPSIPIRKAMAVTIQDGKFREVLGTYSARPWPDDVPSECEACGTKFRSGFNLSIGPGKLGRRLLNGAYFGFPPFLAIAFIVPLVFPDAFRDVSDKGFIAWLVCAMLFPPMILAGLSMIMPRSRLLECKECGWSRDYKIPKPIPPSS